MTDYPLHGATVRLSTDAWNAEHPIGTAVRYYPVAGVRQWIETRTASEAWSLDRGQAMVMVGGRRGGVLLEHLEVSISGGMPDEDAELLGQLLALLLPHAVDDEGPVECLDQILRVRGERDSDRALARERELHASTRSLMEAERDERKRLEEENRALRAGQFEGGTAE